MQRDDSEDAILSDHKNWSEKVYFHLCKCTVRQNFRVSPEALCEWVNEICCRPDLRILSTIQGRQLQHNSHRPFSDRGIEIVQIPRHQTAAALRHYSGKPIILLLVSAQPLLLAVWYQQWLTSPCTAEFPIHQLASCACSYSGLLLGWCSTAVGGVVQH